MGQACGLLMVCLLVLVEHAAAQDRGEMVRGQPYERFQTTDGLDRTIIYYLSEPGGGAAALPLVVYVQGSGCTSHFTRRGDRIVPRNGHIGIQQVLAGRARLLIVEKPGVEFLDDPTTPATRSGSAQFRVEHTLDRWSEAVVAAIRAAHDRPDIAPGRTLVIGHSEGGIVAARIARRLPRVVTDVAILAGGGPSQLFSLITLARRGEFFSHVSDDPEARVAHVIAQWQAILDDPQSTEELFFGFAYRRWSSFLASSPSEELAETPARVYIAQGTEDRAVDPASADMLYVELLRRGREVHYDRVEGADHSFHVPGGDDGWQQVTERVLRWFLEAE
jgi:pimeloyl-ACP methyl ester carboxylesterase